MPNQVTNTHGRQLSYEEKLALFVYPPSLSTVPQLVTLGLHFIPDSHTRDLSVLVYQLNLQLSCGNSAPQLSLPH